MKRIKIIVSFNRRTGMWGIGATDGTVWKNIATQKGAIMVAAAHGRSIKARGGLAEMLVKSRDGSRFTTAGATYGRDPKRSKG